MKIGIFLKITEDLAMGVAAPKYTEIREQALAVEECGFDSIWLQDHLLSRIDEEGTEGVWECWTLLSALAEATNRVEIGPLVICNPFRNPALLAKMAHTLDEVSEGRLILGVGAGWHQPEFDAFGYSFERRVDRFEEALQILTPLLKGKSVDFEGVYYQVRDCVITPRGPRAQGVPLMVGTNGPRMLRLAARYADLRHTASSIGLHDLPEQFTRMRHACAEVDRDPATLPFVVGIRVDFPDLGAGKARENESVLTGSPEQIATAFRSYDDAGVAHLTLYGRTDSLPAIQRLAESLRLYRESD